jgi:hypothetical protein
MLAIIIMHAPCSLSLHDSYPRRTIADLQAASKSAIDPFQLVEKDVSTLSGGIKDLLGSDHPVLESCAK